MKEYENEIIPEIHNMYAKIVANELKYERITKEMNCYK